VLHPGDADLFEAPVVQTIHRLSDDGMLRAGAEPIELLVADVAGARADRVPVVEDAASLHGAAGGVWRPVLGFEDVGKDDVWVGGLRNTGGPGSQDDDGADVPQEIGVSHENSD